MFRTEKIEKLIELTIYSGFLQGPEDIPLSLMLIADQESAKTKILQLFKDSHHIIYLLDLSPREFTHTLLPELKTGKIKHLIIPDFTKITAHRPNTVDNLIAIFNAVMEEGLEGSNLFFGQSYNLDQKVNAGIITALTTKIYFQQVKKWSDIGFITRFFPVSFDYNKETIQEIHNLIRESKIESMQRKVQYNGHAKEIGFEMDVTHRIQDEAQQLAHKMSQFEYKVFVNGYPTSLKLPIKGFRLHVRLRTLCRACALKNNHEKVTYEDFMEVRELLSYINYPNNPIML